MTQRVTWARREGGLVLETFQADVGFEFLTPADTFRPELAAQFELCPADVQPGWALTDGEWSPRPEAE